MNYSVQLHFNKKDTRWSTIEISVFIIVYCCEILWQTFLMQNSRLNSINLFTTQISTSLLKYQLTEKILELTFNEGLSFFFLIGARNSCRHMTTVSVKLHKQENECNVNEYLILFWRHNKMKKSCQYKIDTIQKFIFCFSI